MMSLSSLLSDLLCLSMVSSWPSLRDKRDNPLGLQSRRDPSRGIMVLKFRGSAVLGCVGQPNGARKKNRETCPTMQTPNFCFVFVNDKGN
ncbi:hypothetical protein F4775DRAFT_344860 [Biscogniauxia sp. FL1348]|nr:hypothetical protein F4775DRAFT_344860 [Biscogniauxia sp. FL1348]